MAFTKSPGRRGDPTWLPDVLRAFGVTVIEDEGWTEWGMGDFDTIWGVIAHHTGANNTSTNTIRWNPNLEYALSSQIHLSRKGVVTLVGAGIAWHAGKGSYPGLPTNNANFFTIGIEAQGDGQTWPPEEMEAYYRTVAAILWYLGLPASRCISHWEYSMAAQGKWDPGLNGKPMPMGPFRTEVQARIDKFNQYGTLDVVPQKEEGLFMALSPERQEELAAKIDAIHHELTHEFQSLVTDENGKQSTWRGTLVGMMLQVDKKVEAMHAHMLPGVITKIQELFKKESV
ncbi:peptidoglycan recognition protein family protein [Corynebacterium callunae]|uniref:N-acetylmuramoyl-L-alanine amidase domain-containing protein n=1 Tax=Corynebacterium callunae DSM 20147 TaxID=1121353 RepID=M1UFC3_9CORY|nr:N-acetylmuramoyl-L-alanine amidase [Corynebacterium callunae]AGG66865.1 hypothetical protein H924_07115 [Corynebacterium callunae DSM 20147]